MPETTTLVAIHGLGGDRGQPLELLDRSVRSRCRVVAPDMRAHGVCNLDEDPARLTFGQLAADLEATLSSDAGPFILLGVSMGAGIALELVARGLPRVRSAILVRPAWLWQPHPPNLAAFPTMAALLRTHGAEAGRARFVAGEDYARCADVSPAAAEALAAQFDAPRAEARAGRLEALPASAPSRPARVGIPVFVLCGDLDPVHPVTLAADLAADLGARLIEVPPRYDEAVRHRSAVTRSIRELTEEV